MGPSSRAMSVEETEPPIKRKFCIFVSRGLGDHLLGGGGLLPCRGSLQVCGSPLNAGPGRGMRASSLLGRGCLGPWRRGNGLMLRPRHRSPESKVRQGFDEDIHDAYRY